MREVPRCETRLCGPRFQVGRWRGDPIVPKPTLMELRVGEIVTREMWLHDAEDAVSAELEVATSQAVHLVQFAIRSGVLRTTFNGGKVRPGA